MEGSAVVVRKVAKEGGTVLGRMSVRSGCEPLGGDAERGDAER